MPPPQPQWGPQDPAGRYFCDPYSLDGRARLAPVPLDPAQRLAWDGIITNSAAFASHDGNANALASSDDLSNDVDKMGLASFDEVSYPEYAEELVPDGEVFDCDDPGKFGPSEISHDSDAKALDVQEDAFHYEDAEELESLDEASEAVDVEERNPPGESINNKAAGNFDSLTDAPNGGAAENLPSDASSSLTSSVNQIKDAVEPNASGFDDSGSPPDDEGEKDEDLEAGANEIGSAQQITPGFRCELCAYWDAKNKTVPICNCAQGRFHPECLANAGTWVLALECINCHGLTRHAIRRPIPPVVKQKALRHR